jgi:electron transfer flavoprotein-quinone oxidoreductase
MEALNADDFSARMLSRYKKKLEQSFVIKDMKTFKNAAGMMHMNRLYQTYPKLLTSIMQKMYRTSGTPRLKLWRLIRKEALKEAGLRNLIADGFKIGRSLL